MSTSCWHSATLPATINDNAIRRQFEPYPPLATLLPAGFFDKLVAGIHFDNRFATRFSGAPVCIHYSDFRYNLSKLITSLRKARPGGSLYTRPPQIEAKLAELEALSLDDLVERAEILQHDHPGYVPSECLVYFVRASRNDKSTDAFKRLYEILAGRVLRSLPRVENAEGVTISLTNAEIRDFVFDRFVELLAKDRSEYCEELDFYEVRFNQALSRLRMDASEKARRDERRTLSLDADDDSGEPSCDAEWAAGGFDQSSFEGIEDKDYRSHLLAAIDTLPVEQARVIAMLLKGIPIDAQEPGVMTISKALGRSEKTIRTYRDKAFASIKAIMSKGE